MNQKRAATDRCGGFVREKDLQQAVVDLCRVLGLRCYHTHDSRRSTPGFPDLVIVGRGGVLWRELKTATGRVSPQQLQWLEALVVAGQDAAVWRPQHWPGVVRAELEAIR